MNKNSIIKLNIKNFRNFYNETVEFSSNLNCIFGKNGNGKTNLLEVIHYLSNKKSFKKNTTFQQLINIECENPQIILSAVYKNDEKEFYYSGKIENKNSQWFLDNKATNKKLDIKTIFLNPFDSFLFHSTSSFRRNWIDQYFGLYDKEYKKTLNQYNSSLKFRNNLLSKKPVDYKNQILANEDQFCELGHKVNSSRRVFLRSLNKYISEIFKEIFDETHLLELKISSKINYQNVNSLRKHYQEKLELDMITGHTTSGVHRDDFIFNFDGFNSFEFCSLGQQKMSFLSLLFAYIELFRYKFNTYPIVLIDDVSGELDKGRWKKLITYIKSKDFQVLITTANENFKNELEKINDAQKIFIENGTIKVL